jgi:UTP--glucose-1-phosphate uridylyltransferase
MIGKCLFPVAGYGTRFLPATKSMPKEMLPIVNKPLVQYGVEEAIEAGMNNCAFVTGRGKRAIADHFDTSYELEHQIAGSTKEQHLQGIREVMDRGVFTTVRQRSMRGLGHAILTGEPLIGDEPFGVVLSDDLCLNAEGAGVLTQMAALYEEFQCSIVAVQTVSPAEISSYGAGSGPD